ncbi:MULTISPECIES: PadR family transcriptional regulator [Streptomyces]|uniref:PadR family transcriptional regulator n=1 Tax=Streptomyces albus (strain ATCC 21838 / DSM 41398 / FERM P-419 / JCM 4703 / NBRC 107858) TaxID=1081613 RepID=A0A0B5EMG8_STRA4|nr:PadR family transcriptional regulator [Streptomyces sp. SCSIO ZS0520]AJE80555.1 hypothetical protein SLNWT_0179 [Streptomyces albus]AOU74873.1 hypothetical protein SLNHY_0182 [Streptomyces albus]AYN30681.1 PadR family transcriptional regulator [Streptomyces albus]
MALRNAILAALADGEFSGYDLAKSFDAAVANFWSATPQQLYRELERLDAQGLVRARLVEQQRRPNKRLFSLTDAGRAALREFTARAPRPTAIRDELLVQVEAVDLGDTAGVRSHLQARLAAARGKLQDYERSRARLLDGRTEEEYLAGERRLGPYLTLARGLAFERENIRWYGFALRALADRHRVRGAADA